jgi:hypothetical protein
MRRLFLIGFMVFVPGAAQASFAELRHYTPAAWRPPKVIFINQLPLEQQPVLQRLLKKTNASTFSTSYAELSDTLFNQGYQLIVATYYKRNEWLGPGFNTPHLFLHVPVRSQNRFVSERKKMDYIFAVLDEWVMSQSKRSLCLIIHLPPQSLHSLQSFQAISSDAFAARRDFSLIHLYHQIHRRSYLHNAQVLVIQNLNSTQAILVGNGGA